METYLSPWLQMDLSSWDSVIQDIKPFSLEKGSLLFANGDFLSNVYIVKSGTLLQINTGDNGNEKILFFMVQIMEITINGVDGIIYKECHILLGCWKILKMFLLL